MVLRRNGHCSRAVFYCSAQLFWPARWQFFLCPVVLYVRVRFARSIQGIFAAQYDVLRKRGHTPSEAFNETVEELTQSLMPLVAENGMDWMYANCSTTAQRGALDWWKKFRDATAPVFEELYESVATGKESQRSIDSNSLADYRAGLEEELKELRDSEMWQAGKTVRSLRPENQPAKA